MITILLEQIIELIKGWISAFTGHAQHVEDKLDSIDSTASDIKDNTDSLPDIEDNTAAVITPISNIKSNTDSIASSNTTIANNTTAISNQVSAMSTNVGRAAAYAEDCANNSLNILDKVTTIASDTTQIRTDTGNMSLEQSKIYDAVKWLLADKTIEETEDGQDSVSFDTDMTEDLTGLTVGLVATQSGSGTPSPDNVRTINGYSDINLTVNGNSVIISLGNTYYGGMVDVVNGLLILTYGYTDLGSLSWVSESAAVSGLFRSSITNCKWRSVLLCSAYKYSSVTQYNQINDLEIALTNTEALPYLRCRNTAFNTYTAAQFKTAVTGVQLVYELNTPIEIALTPMQISTLKGVNTITTDTNGEVTVTYKESIKHYLDKQDN